MRLNQKGFAPIFFVLGLLVVLILWTFLYKNQSTPDQTTKTNLNVNNPIPTPVSFSALPKLDPSDKSLLVLNNDTIGPNPGQIAVTLPMGSVWEEKSAEPGSRYIIYNVSINNITYSVSINGNPNGLCPNSDDGTNCGYDDLNFPNTDSVRIGTYRIWHNKSGNFAINPQSINVDNNSSISQIVLNKIKPNAAFTQSEIDLWILVLQSAKLYQTNISL